MRTTTSLIIKFLATSIAAWITFSLIDGNTINFVLLVGASGTILNYLLSDLMILPAMGNIPASISDGLLAIATAYAVDLLSDFYNTSVTGLIIFGVIITVFEYFFHIYLMNDDKVAPNDFHRDTPIE